MLSELQNRIEARLIRLYGREPAPEILVQILQLVGETKHSDAPRQPLANVLSERDVMLITYGDQVSTPGEAPLRTLHGFLKLRIGGVVNSIHILPFYPYTSDDGFSVVDYMAVNPAVGDWNDIEALRGDFRLMFDAVFNHISASSAWFQGFLQGEQPYRNYFTTVNPATDLSQVVRPRTHPLLTPFETASGIRHVWTTFSADQIDLNFANPDVLIELLRVLLFYTQKGADFIRLDAIAFIWKIIGTSCIHLEEAHLVIQIMRDFLDLAAPETILITETNVPHKENIAYFGDGKNEAQLVYQFPLPPLILHTLHTANASALTRWAQSLSPVSDETTFLNFLASHDGIGVRPVTGLLSEAEVNALVQLATDHGGYVSYRAMPDGSKSPYELNISYFDAITHPDITAATPEVAVQRFLVSQAIMLSLGGVPGIYFHSLLGSRNYREGVTATGHNRTINREKLDLHHLDSILNNPESLRFRVFDGYMRLIQARISHPAFHPLGGQIILDVDPALFVVERRSRDETARIIALHNVTGQTITTALPRNAYAKSSRDVITGMQYNTDAPLSLAPYQILWLSVDD